MSEFFKTELSKKVFMDRYAMKNEKGEPLETSPEEMWWRVARAVAEVEEDKEKWAKIFYKHLYDFKFVPGGRILSGAGTGAEVTYANCYVIPSPEDSYDGIFENIHTMGKIMRHGGGVGVDLSSLRPKGEFIAGTKGFSSGPVAFAEIYSQTTLVTSQAGTRRGALMLMLRDDHPDIFDFVNAKLDLSKLNGANLSVKISDAFMEAVQNDGLWDLKWGGKVYRTVRARELWDAIIKAAHKSAEPGLWFSERSNKLANSAYFEELIATNPCGEQPLSAWGVCNLGAINLSKFVDKERQEVKWDDLRNTVQVAVRFLDNVIDVTKHPYPEIQQEQDKIRRVGLGTMGLADMLIYLGIRYGSPEAVDLTEKIYSFIADVAYDYSAELAKEKGAFPAYDEEYLNRPFIKKLALRVQDKIRAYGIRNCYLLTQAPTGSTGALAQVAGTGIEPVFDFEFKRTDRLGEHIVRLPIVDELIEMGRISPNREEWPDYMVTARELTPYEHVDMQAAIQKYTDASVSKTVNAPSSYTEEDVANLYMYGYKKGLKGITVYVDGSREGVLNYLDKEEEKPAKEAFVKRPQILEGKTIKMVTPVGKAYITVNVDDQNRIDELFIKLGKTGADVSAIADGLAIALTGYFSPRLSRLSPEEKLNWIIKQFRGISGVSTIGFGENRVSSLPDAIAKALQMLQEEKDSKEPTQLEFNFDFDEKSSQEAYYDLCPECGTFSMANQEGCSLCFNCGYSKC